MMPYEEERTNAHPHNLNYVSYEALKTTVSYRTISRVNLEHTSIIRTGDQTVVMGTETVAETLNFSSELTLHHSLTVERERETLQNVGICSELMPHYSLEVKTEGLRKAECLFRINAAKFPDDGERDSFRNLGYLF
jgi:hypothetical protein